MILLKVSRISYSLMAIALATMIALLIFNATNLSNYGPPPYRTRSNWSSIFSRNSNYVKDRMIMLGCRKDRKSKSTICDHFTYSAHRQLDVGFNDARIGDGRCISRRDKRYVTDDAIRGSTQRVTRGATQRVTRYDVDARNSMRRATRIMRDVTQRAARNFTRQKNQPNTTAGRNSEGIVWIMGFVDFRHRNYRKNMAWSYEEVTFADGQFVSAEALEARMSEIVDALKTNLKNELIESIHVLVKEWDTFFYLRTLDLVNSNKLVLHYVEEDVSITMLFEYAIKCLQDNIVSISNQDNMMGAGWGQLQPRALRENKTLYAITRRPSFNNSCFVSAGSTCKHGGGSYDTFVFHVKENLSFDDPLMRGVTANVRNMEHVLIWILQKKLGYTVINPCLTLAVHHQHCVPIREGRRRKLYPKLPGRKGTSWRAPSVKLSF